MKSGEGGKRGNPAVRNKPCPGGVGSGPVPADSLQEMRDTDFQMGLRRENACLGIHLCQFLIG